MPNLIVASTFKIFTIRVTFSFLASLLFTFTFLNNCFGQTKRDSLESVNNGFSIITAGQVYSHCNGGIYYKGHDTAGKNSNYHKILQRPMVSHTIGIRYQNLYQLLDFNHQSRDGEYGQSSAYGSENIKMTYLGYQVWYDFLPKIKFTFKPLIALNISFIDKKYHYNPSSNVGGNIKATNFKDHSTTIFVQIPVGFNFLYRSFFISCAYNFPIFAWISGSLDYSSFEQSGPSTVKTENSIKYSGNSFSRDYSLINNIITLKIGCSLNFKNK